MNSSSSVNRILSVARNAFREAVRDRVLYNLVLFVLLITAAAVFLGDLTAGFEARVIVNMGLSAALVFGAFIAIFVGVGLVSKEIEKRTVYAIFSKPVGRSEFIVGKYLGLCLTLLVNIIVMGAGISAALWYVRGMQFIGGVWCALGLIFFELIILTAAAILFSTFSSPSLSALLTFFIFVIGHFSVSLRDFAAALGSQTARVFFEALYYVLPNFSSFTFITPAANGQIPSFGFTGAAAAYALVYVIVLLCASALIFSRRNFK
jgi:ABC-type transport system involved in multi-copper enzyme maturation permease subunit